MNLDDHRRAIDALDREILERLNERARHAQAIGGLKGGSAAYRPEREAQVLRGLHAANAGPLPGLTCWNSVICHSWPSITSTSPFLKSAVEATVFYVSYTMVSSLGNRVSNSGSAPEGADGPPPTTSVSSIRTPPRSAR